jgi:hypothetical protein
MLATLNWWTLLRHLMLRAFSFAWASAGNNMLARIPMMAMTTSNSISVKAAHSAGSVVMPFLKDNRRNGRAALLRRRAWRLRGSAALPEKRKFRLSVRTGISRVPFFIPS